MDFLNFYYNNNNELSKNKNVTFFVGYILALIEITTSFIVG